MIRVNKKVLPEDITHDARHVLFVEGRSKDSLDIQIMSELFDGMILIETLGASFNVKSVAQALHPFHPSYYFIIDRDHHDDEFVNQCWENFPDPNKNNLLVWKYREIENYFLEPNYLALSDFLEVSKKVLENKIKEACKERLYLDAANHVIVSTREELKRNWIQMFTNPAEFETREQAIGKLRSASEFETFKNDVAAKVNLDDLEQRFNGVLDMMTGGVESLEFGKGKWLEMIQGKRVLSRVVHSDCFKVADLKGNLLEGRAKLNQIVKNLLRKDISTQPKDFRELKHLIQNRLDGKI